MAILESAKSNVLNLNGSVITPDIITYAWGFGHAIGQKVKLVNIGTPLRSQLDQETLEQFYDRLDDWGA